MRAVLLDLDKTLVNVEDHTDYCSALKELKAKLGDVKGGQVPQTYWGRCTLEAMAILTALEGERWEEASRILARYEVEGARRSTPMPGLREFMEMVGRLSVSTAIVTLLSQEAAMEVLARHGISADVVIGRRFGLKLKPHPDQVLEAMRLLSVSAGEAVMVGDSEWDEAAATAAGLSFLAITNGRQRHGFTRAVAIVPTLTEAAEALRRLVGRRIDRGP